jgi:hypothetical protein
MMTEPVLEVNRAFSADEFLLTKTWGVAPGYREFYAFSAKHIGVPVLLPGR